MDESDAEWLAEVEAIITEAIRREQAALPLDAALEALLDTLE